MSDDLENDEGVRRSSRRRESTQQSSKREALQALREAKKSGKVHRPKVDSLVKDVYETVDEEEYASIVRKRQDEDFVIDDDGSGYVDHGADVFDDEYDDDDEELLREKKKKKKKDAPAKKGGIGSFFTAQSAPRAKVKDESQVKLDEDSLKDLLATLDDSCLDANYELPAPSRRVEHSNPFARGAKRPAPEESFTPRPVTKKVALTTKHSDSTPMSRSSKLSFGVSRPSVAERAPSPIKQESVDDAFDDDFGGDSAHDDIYEPPQSEPVAVAEIPKQDIKEEVEEEKPRITDLPKYSEVVWETEDNGKDDKVEVVSGAEEFYVEENGQKRIRMYWMDAFEDPVKHAGTVYLFGRVCVGGGRSASCSVVVKNIYRQVYFLPKEMCADGDVYEDIKAVLLREVGVTTFKCKKTHKKFMYDGTLDEGEHEKEVSVFEVHYESSHPPLRRDLTGKTFHSVFNTTTTAMERLLVEREMMGPGWIDVSNYVEVQAKQTYCEYEFTVDMERLKHISYNNDDKSLPPFARMLALNVVTCLNGNNNEICMISSLFNPKCDLNNPSTDRKSLQRFCVMTKTSSSDLPFNLSYQLKQNGLTEDIVKTVSNENKLFSIFLAKMQKWEPDIIVGHDITAMIDLLKTRIQKLNVVKWDRISRLKRSVPISHIKSNKFGHWELSAGRLLLDSRLSAMELVRSRSYDLTELSSLLLNTARREIYANEVPLFYGKAERCLDLISYSWEDPYLSLRVIAQLNALPLAIQITNIAGGVTSRTLMGGRAERNEYLLMHAFNRGNIIAPNKHQPNFAKNDKKNDKVKTETQGEEPSAEDSAGKNKAQYAGGLVLEPKKGLYDTLILLLDFNSLYPSIIQEFNICFTTVKHTKDGNEVADVPESGLSEGVLPKEIRGLVERRRQVKALMKSKDLTESKRKQYDIRQMALKLTANSMYGCLGFQQSRFYAKPLAALITSKGREILMHSKDLVEKMGYTVVYGDTDSIMINTNSTDLQQAKKLGNEIKKQVNQCHRLLELDLDGVFKRMLLLKKKKYAALTVNPDDERETKKELKGLDIVRRDWSLLAKHAGTEVVDLILNPSLVREELVVEILECLRRLRTRLDEGGFDVKTFEISKQLTRNPKEYKDLKAQPHASVAMRLNESGRFALKHGDIVEYIICEDGTTNPATQRAYHQTELADNKELKIDMHYYLAQQVHPVVSRLCAPIEETDAVRIAEALGMDPTSYRRSAAALAAEKDEDEAAWQGPLNYDHCDGIAFVCPGKCGNTVRIRSAIIEQESEVKFSLEACEKCQCPLYEYPAFIENAVDNALSGYVAKHMSSVFKCDETVCEYQTASHPLKWCREGLECPKCSGVLRKEYSAKDLFDQQSFYKEIAELLSAMEKLKPEQKRSLEGKPCFVEMKRLSLKLCSIIDEYLQRNAYNRVDLSFLFAPMLKI